MIFQHHLQPQGSFSLLMTLNLKPVCHISDCLSMQTDLHYLTTWSQCWNLNFNAAKCALLWFSSGYRPTAFNYILNDDLISAQKTHRDLGIIVSSDLSWREQVKNILSTAYKTLNLIRCLFSTGHRPQTKKILYLSLVIHSVHRFGIPTFWKTSSIIQPNTS